MSIVIVNPGDLITESWFQDSANTITDVINGQGIDTMRRDALGLQHVPSLMANVQPDFTRRPKDYKTKTTPMTVSAAFAGVSSSDIVGEPWDTVLTANGAGGGWDLAGDCKVLVVATVVVDAFDTEDDDNAAYMAVTRSIDGGAHEMEAIGDWRFIMGDDEHCAGQDPVIELEGLKRVHKQMQLWTIIDKSSSTDFTLSAVRLYAACGNETWTLATASLLVYAFHVG